MRKSLERIAWSMPAFGVLVTDLGGELKLTGFSPQMVRSLLRKAVPRGLEWGLGARLDLKGRA
eukprot:4449020-Pyramimonas_sp.AAC.1